MESKSGSYPNPNWIYDVYLSFCGQDTCASFVSHLYAALANAGVSVYRDEMLSKGDSIEHSVLWAIEASRISIVVFSINYASSKWCMEELVKIMEYRRTIGQIVVPVFYHVDPSHVRHQAGEVGEAFTKYKRMSVEKDKLQRRRVALTEAKNLPGFHLRGGWNEAALVMEIVEDVMHKLELFVPESFSGVESHVKDVIELLNSKQSKDVLVLGIWGMQGIGKTTIANVIFNQIGHNFEQTSFISNIREVWKRHTKWAFMERVLRTICRTEKTIHDVDSGKYLLKKIFAQKRVLLVLDDVNKLDQLNALCESSDWVGPGSKIIITTRDMHILREYGVDCLYRMEGMNESDSLKHFNMRACQQTNLPEKYALARNIVDYIGGLPLALKATAWYLRNESIEMWNSVLDNFKRGRFHEILEVLKSSVDDLEHNEKEIFFDIASFFIGKDQNDVIQILNGCGFFAEVGIRVLIDRSLITVDDENKLCMHNLLRDMGREIIRQESPRNPAKRSRICLHEEVLDVLQHNMGSLYVEGLALKLRGENTTSLTTKSFGKMKVLRLLQLVGVQLDGDFKDFPRDLKWLCWHGFPLPYIPEELYQRSLVVLELKYSNLIQLWENGQMMENLKVLNLSHSSDLTTTPDFSYLPNLEKLILKNCPCLFAISHTIGHLTKLVLLNLKDCTSLFELPRSVYKLNFLQTLILSGCSLIDKLEEDLEQMESLTTLIADKTSVTKIPFSIVKLKSIEYISLCGYKGHSHDVFPSLLRDWMLVTTDLSSLVQMDVFLSFNKEDFSASFTSYLYTSLQNIRGIVFKDNHSQPGGDHISNLILQAIEKSQVSIIVFSRNYANALWCLEELEKIMECRRNMGQVILPVFHEVNPLEVCDQTGKFGEAFKNLLNRFSIEEDRVLSWRRALHEAANSSAFPVNNFRFESEEDINSVVEHISNLSTENLFIANYPMGLKSRVQEVIQLLKDEQSEYPLLLGIWGMGGIGKTTIAKDVYKQISPDFENKSFLLNVRESWRKDNGQVSLQKTLLSDIYKGLNLEIPTVEIGKMRLKEKLQSKKVLLLLDNVNKLEQLHALCGSREWFGFGSIIIITTRDKHLLEIIGVDLLYRVRELDESESLELFSWHAFRQPSPQREFDELSKEVVTLSGGLPFALQVHGSILFGSKKSEWEKMLQKLKTIPSGEVQDILKTSFEDLNDEEKIIFLDIACFYVGMDLNCVIQSLTSSQQSTREEKQFEEKISALDDKSLVTIENTKLGMHVLLQQMAREIIRKESQIKTKSRIYDVFLSFRGETRATFTSHLYTALQTAGNYTFRDNEEIERGSQISMSLLQAIGNSRICVIVFSKNYPNSRWCMLEFENIVRNHKTNGFVVVPVFYYVYPSDVRKQKRDFGKAFQELVNKTSVKEEVIHYWKSTLNEIGGIAGFVVNGSSDESADITRIVDSVTRLLDKRELFIAKHPVGVKYRGKQAIEQLKNHESKDVLLLGIWGMGGIGKTTIAKEIYNRIGEIGDNFEGRCFLADVRGAWQSKQDTSKVCLQQQVLNDICGKTKMRINNIHNGKQILGDKLAGKKVLLVLDDVDDSDQLNVLCGSEKWFGSGSRIIITTRDKRLIQEQKIPQILFKIKEMDKKESLEQFSWHAFNQARPPPDFVDWSEKVVGCCMRLPLALEVLGSHLYGRTKEEWGRVVNALNPVRDDKIHKNLKVSYDGLNVDQKGIFLDIACFLIGMNQYDVIQILKDYSFDAKSEIGVLIERGLVTVDDRNKLGMHHLLREMGREIIRVESRRKPEKRSRLWLSEEVVEVLSKEKGSKAVEGLALKLPSTEIECLTTTAFKKMKSLRLLQLAGVQLNEDFIDLPSTIKWLHWHGFPIDHTLSKFHEGDLVVIELKNSKLKQWEMGQMNRRLKNLNLSHSQYLIDTPDFSYMPNLEKLILKDCPRLSEVSDTIGCLNNLLEINLKNCTGLQNLPKSMYKLKSLKILILSGCSKIDKLEQDIEQMKSLTTFKADNTGIRKVPVSIVRRLKSIEYIAICGFEGSSCDVFLSLIRSWMPRRSNLISLIQTSRVSLDGASCSTSHSVSSTFKELPKLRSLYVDCDSEDQPATPDEKRILKILKDRNYKKVEASATTSQISGMDMSPVSDWCRQVKISGSANFLRSLSIQIETEHQLHSISRDSILQTTDGLTDSFWLPNDYDWLSFTCEGSSLIFEVPQINGNNLKRMMLCIVHSSSHNREMSKGCQSVLIINHTKPVIWFCKIDTLTSFEDEEWQNIRSDLEPGDKVEVIVDSSDGFNVEKPTVYLFYDKPIEEETEDDHAVNKDVIDPSRDKSAKVTSNKVPIWKPKKTSWTEETSGRSKESSYFEKLIEGPKARSNLLSKNLPYEDEPPLIPLTNRKTSNNRISQSSSKTIKTSTELTQCSSQDMNQDRKQNVEVDDSTNPDTSLILPNLEQMQVEGNVHNEEMEHCHAIDKDFTSFGDNGIAADKNFIFYCGDDLSNDKDIFVSGGDENENDNKHCLAGDKDVIVSDDDDDDEVEDNNFTISSGDENTEVASSIAPKWKSKKTSSTEETSGRSKASSSSENLMEVPEVGLVFVPMNLSYEDEQPLTPLRKRKTSNNQIGQSSSKIIKISIEPTQCSSQEMNQDINQNMEVDDSANPDTSIFPKPERMQGEGNVHIFKHQLANLQSEENARSSKIQTVEESRPIDPPHLISLQADNGDQVKEQSVETLQVVPNYITKQFDFDAMNQLINNDPLSAIENMLLEQISVSSEIQQLTTQMDTTEIETSLANQLLEDLKIYLFNKEDISDALLRELDTKKVKFIFEELSKVHNQLPAATRAFISQSHKVFNEALTHKKNYAHAISRLSSYEQTNAFAEKALRIKENEKSLATLSALSASSQEKLHGFNKQIVALEKELEELKKQRASLRQDMTKCEEQSMNIKTESGNLARQSMPIWIKIKETKDDLETYTAGYEASKAVFKELKSKVPF